LADEGYGVVLRLLMCVQINAQFVFTNKLGEMIFRHLLIYIFTYFAIFIVLFV